MVAENGWDSSYDFVIVGSGGGALCAAIRVRDLGGSVLVLEKEDKVGGSTSMSGGVLWIPCNPLLARAGRSDSVADALRYLDAAVGDVGPASSVQRRTAYIEGGIALINYLEEKGVPFIPNWSWSDYYDELPGALSGGRSLGVDLFDARNLGPWENLLRRGPVSLPIRTDEFAPVMLAKRTLHGFYTAMKLGFRMIWMRLTGAKVVGAGTALQARLLDIALRSGADIRTGYQVTDFVPEGDGIAGVVVNAGGKEIRIRGKRGTLINSGGFARNLDMRRKFLPAPTSVEWTHSNPGETGEVLQAAIGHGAAVSTTDAAIWQATSVAPDHGQQFHDADFAKAHIIRVGSDGRRFCNESASYMENGQRAYASGAVPSWAIFDSRHRKYYPWGMAAPGLTPPQWLSSGYLKTADTIAELAARCGIDVAGLTSTVERFNGFARSGKDEDFHRGDRRYDHVWADPRIKPNPGLGAIEQAPFYAVEIWPGDVGTFGGLLTDEHGRVLQDNGGCIPGLYATGNVTASVMGRCYVGAGASIGASCIFGFRAASFAFAEGEA